MTTPLPWIPRFRLDELGAVVSQHPVGASRRLGMVGAMFVPTFSAIFFIAAVAFTFSGLVYWAFGVGVAAFCAWATVAGFQRAWPKVLASFSFEVREKGLVAYGSRRNVRGYPWEALKELRYDAVPDGGFVAESLQLRFADRSGFVVDGGHEGFAELKRAISDAWLKRSLPSALGTLRSGGSLPFGPVTLSQSGLTFGDGLHRWKDVAALLPFRGTLLIKRNDGRSVNAAALRDLQDPVLLFALAENLLPHSTALTQ